MYDLGEHKSWWPELSGEIMLNLWRPQAYHPRRVSWPRHAFCDGGDIIQEVITGPGHDQLVRGLGRWTAACELADILEMFLGTHTHLVLADQHGPMSGEPCFDPVFVSQIMGAPCSCLLASALVADLIPLLGACLYKPGFKVQRPGFEA